MCDVQVADEFQHLFVCGSAVVPLAPTAHAYMDFDHAGACYAAEAPLSHGAVLTLCLVDETPDAGPGAAPRCYLYSADLWLPVAAVNRHFGTDYAGKAASDGVSGRAAVY